MQMECHFTNLTTQSMIKFSTSLLPRSVEKRPIDWIWDPIFWTNWDVRDVDKLSWDFWIILGPHWGKWAILVQSAHSWISSPDFHNQSIQLKTENAIEWHSKWNRWYRVAKTHRMPTFIGHFPQKSPIISGSSAKRDLQLVASYGQASMRESRYEIVCVKIERVSLYVCACVCVCVIYTAQMLTSAHRHIYIWHNTDIYIYEINNRGPTHMRLSYR